MALLMECLSLFERSAGSLSLENLKEAVDEFRELKFHSGSVQLALAVAKYSDPTGAGIQYAAEGQPKDVPMTLFLSDRRIHVRRSTRNVFAAMVLSSKSWTISTMQQ
jgi:nuclear pore complex protein Nup155